MAALWDKIGHSDALFYQAVAGGEGATLLFETVKQHNAAGREEDAAHHMELIAFGAEKLRDGVAPPSTILPAPRTAKGSGQN